ncbi:MAG: winged helix-turn-helix domain-containing protein, partial [Pseudomonadota bacterium]|nr:winged helix-turn-helix domain-containing protein [Pseudomonadota bacterium]
TQIDMPSWLPPFLDTLQRFAQFNQCQSIEITQISPPALSSIVREFLTIGWEKVNFEGNALTAK